MNVSSLANVPDIEIPAQTVNQRAYDRLCELILSGHLRFGERLDERMLADRMKISRTPIRDAIGRLATEGLVERRPYQGNFVRTFNSEQIRGLYDVRRELEVLAVRLAVARASRAEVEDLASIVAKCHAAFERGDLVGFERFDQQFHERIAVLSGNETLVVCLDNLRLQVQLARHYANQSQGMAERSILDRNGIVKGFFDKDVKAATDHMAAHIDDGRAAFASQIDAGIPMQPAQEDDTEQDAT